MSLLEHENTPASYRDPIDLCPDGVPGLAQVAVGQGWRPLAGRPFDGSLGEAVRDITRALHGLPGPTAGDVGLKAGATAYGDAFRGRIGGRTVIVANAWTSVEPESAGQHAGVAVCAVDLPALVPPCCVQPRRVPALVPLPECPAGNPAFDLRFLVAAPPGSPQVLTWDVQQQILAREDWVFRAERYLLACVSADPFRTVSEVSHRIGEVLAIAAGICASVPPADDDPDEDLIARASQLTSLESAITFLKSLSPAGRATLAQSATPLAALADVTTPQEAISRFQALDQERKLQLIALFHG
jgi:hypothetical protein